eukprot:94757-Hanusia_phi.AAC.8
MAVGWDGRAAFAESRRVDSIRRAVSFRSSVLLSLPQWTGSSDRTRPGPSDLRGSYPGPGESPAA